VTCYLSPILALPAVTTKWSHLLFTIGGHTLVLPVEMKSGDYLEFRSPTDCKLYGQKGELLREVKPEGDVPVLEAGANEIEFRCDALADFNARAYVTVITEGEGLRGVNPANKLKSARK